MRNRGLVISALVVLILIVAAAAAITNSHNKNSNTNSTDNMPMDNNSSSQNSSSSQSSAKPVATTTVKITNFAFSPANITVKAGQAVTWTNEDSVEHTVTADTQSGDAPASQTLAKGASYSFTFNKAGTYAYHCQIHPSMKGTVTVTQ